MRVITFPPRNRSPGSLSTGIPYTNSTAIPLCCVQPSRTSHLNPAAESELAEGEQTVDIREVTMMALLS